MQSEDVVIEPQPGFQEKVASCTADIAIIGGSAGGGKTFSLIIEPLTYVSMKGFSASFFRRTQADVKKPGGLFDEAKKWYSFFGGEPTETPPQFRFPSGARITFDGIEHEKDLDKWKGAQIPLIIFDELTDFTKRQFFFMLTRNRGVCKDGDSVLVPYVRASCNPLPGSWVSDLLEWYIDQDTGYPIKERDGVLRYMITYKDNIYWGNSKKECIDACPEAFSSDVFKSSGVKKGDLVKSFTFIRGGIEDNKILLGSDPGYLGNLQAQSEEEQKRFLDGNWKVATDGLGIYEHAAVESMFVESYPDIERIKVGYNQKGEIITRLENNWADNFITCDAAKFGQDLCVIFVWRGWAVIHTSVFYLSSPHDIYSEIELLRLQFGVPKVGVVIDQDGIGGDVVKLGGYAGFIARSEVAPDVTTGKQENYASFKDQCYFHSSFKVNEGVIKVVVNASTCKIFDKGSKHPRYSTKMKWRGEMLDIRTLIKNHLRSIRKGESVVEGGGLLRYKVNSKEEQKEFLSGASPDFADCLMMRQYFLLARRRKGKFKVR